MKTIQLNHITKKFGDHLVLKDISYTFEFGKITAITGKSGCGKSTLLNIIGLMESPTEGTICYDEYGEVTMHNRKAMKLLRNEIAYIFQNYALLDDETVYQNIKLAMEYQKIKDKKSFMIRRLNMVGLSESFLDKKIYALSGGEQQRVAIARALCKPCNVLLADEPTGNLDEENAKEIFSLLKQASRDGKCVIMVTHDDSLASLCDDVIRLDKIENRELDK